MGRSRLLLLCARESPGQCAAAQVFPFPGCEELPMRRLLILASLAAATTLVLTDTADAGIFFNRNRGRMYYYYPSPNPCPPVPCCDAPPPSPTGTTDPAAEPTAK